MLIISRWTPMSFSWTSVITWLMGNSMTLEKFHGKYLHIGWVGISNLYQGSVRLPCKISPQDIFCISNVQSHGHWSLSMFIFLINAWHSTYHVCIWFLVQWLIETFGDIWVTRISQHLITRRTLGGGCRKCPHMLLFLALLASLTKREHWIYKLCCLTISHNFVKY